MTAPHSASEDRASLEPNPAPGPLTARAEAAQRRAALTKLFLSQLFAGAGVASGYAVGAMLAEEITGETAMAGFAQMSTILGAGLLAYPLASLAGRRGRRDALTLGFGIGTLGSLVVLLGVTLQLLPVFMLGMMMSGSAVAAGLQARFAAVDASGGNRPGAAMALVVWATTVGSVLGPNFMAPGAVLGDLVGINPLAGPYLISMGCFLLATIAAFTLSPKPKTSNATNTKDAAPTVGLLQALRFAASNRFTRFAIISLIAGQMVMTNVMVMTPVHMNHQHFDLTAVGIVISIHILGMYVFSPIFGWAADKWGPYVVIGAGFVVYVATIVLGVMDALSESSTMPLLSAALFLLGVGWSLFLIGGSALLVSSAPDHMRMPLQGVADSTMNLGGAFMAALAGTMLQLGGFLLINASAGVVLVITAVFALTLRRNRKTPAATS